MGVTFCLFDFEVRSLVVIIFHIFITMYSYDGKVLGLWNLLSVLGLWNLLSVLGLWNLLSVLGLWNLLSYLNDIFWLDTYYVLSELNIDIQIH